MNEKNRHVLKDALKKLPVYMAPVQLWDGIQKGLREGGNLLKELPVYAAPSDAWQHIVTQLEPKRKPLTYWMVGLGIAATVILLALLPGEEDRYAQTGPISLEKELKMAPLTPALQATYETQLISKEKDLASCMMGLSTEETREARPQLAAYFSLAARQDAFLQLQRTDSLPQRWNDSLIVLEQKREQMLESFFGAYCPQFLQRVDKPSVQTEE